MFAAEARGELPPGTALRWARETPNIARLPERVKGGGKRGKAKAAKAAASSRAPSKTAKGKSKKGRAKA